MTAGIRSVERIRADFPALKREVDGVPVAYFDGPGGTQVPACVADAVRDHLLAHNANSGWRFPTSREAGAVAARARAAVADLVGGTRSGVVFGPSMTSLSWRLARAVARDLGPGDTVVTTRLDHRANVDPWRRVARETGAQFASIPFTADGELDMQRLDDVLATKRVRVVAVTAAANVIGALVDVGAVARRARTAGALCFVDAVHAAAHVRLSAEAWGCDALAASPYKFYGPHAGVLWMSDELMNRLATDRIEPAPATGPQAWEAGTPSYEAMAGTVAAIDWLAGLASDPAEGRTAGFERRKALGRSLEGLHRRGTDLARRMWESLSSIEGVSVYGPGPDAPRTPTIAFSIEGIKPADAAGALAAGAGIFLSHGHFYAPDVLEDLGVEPSEGLLRAGCACYTTEEEIDRLVGGVRELLSR